MKSLITITFISILMLWGTGDYTLDSIVMQRYALIAAFCSMYIVYKVPTYTKPIVAIVLLSGVFTSMWFSIYSNEPFEIQAPLRQHSAIGLVFFVSILMFVLKLSKQHIYDVLEFFGILGIITTVMILFSSNPSGQAPIFDNASMTGCFIAITLFLLPKQLFKIAFPFALLAVLLIKASTPLMCIGGGFIIKYRKNKWMWMALSVVPIFMYFKQPTEGWFHSSGRTWIWKIAMNWLVEHEKLLFGSGLSTTTVLLPMIQVENKQEHNQWFFWLHNDFLQIMFELGIVGLSAFLVMCTNAIYIIRHNERLLPAVVAYGLCMITNFPLHLPIHALLGFLLIGACYK